MAAKNLNDIRLWLGPWRTGENPIGTGQVGQFAPGSDIGLSVNTLDAFNGWVFFDSPTDVDWAAELGPDYWLLASGNFNGARLSVQELSDINARLQPEFPLTQRKVADMLFEYYSLSQPLVIIPPNKPGPIRQNLFMFNQLLTSKPLVPNSPEWDRVMARLETEAFPAQRAISVEQSRKWLGYQVQKLGLTDRDWRKIQGRFQGDGPPLDPETTVSDDFNRPDEPLSSGPWTERAGAVVWSVLSNRVHFSAGSADFAIFDTFLSGEDHLAEILHLDPGALSLGPTCRCSADTSGSGFKCYYGMSYLSTGYIRIWQNANFAEIANVGGVSSPPEIQRLNVDGSDLELFFDDVSGVVGTNTTLIGNTGVGLNGFNPNNGDNFFAEDLGAPPVGGSIIPLKTRGKVGYSGALGTN